MLLPSHYNFKNKVGEQFGTLVVVSFEGKGRFGYLYNCLCLNCNNYKIFYGNDLNKRQSCGCLQRELIARSKRIPQDQIISKIEFSTPYKVLKPNRIVESKWLFECKIHGEFESNCGDIYRNKTGCPACAGHGFDTTKPAYFYVQALVLENSVIALKYGITRQHPKERAKQIQKDSSFKVTNIFYFYFHKGRFALDFENKVKQLVGGNYLTKDQLPNGFTETLPISKLNNIIDLKG